MNFISLRNFSISLSYSTLWARKCPTWGDLSHRFTVRLAAFIFLLGITSVSRYLKKTFHIDHFSTDILRLTCRVYRNLICCTGNVLWWSSWGPWPSIPPRYPAWCWSDIPPLSVSSRSSARPGPGNHRNWIEKYECLKSRPCPPLTWWPRPCQHSCRPSSLIASWWCRELNL